MKIKLLSRDLENKWLFYSVGVVLHWNKQMEFIRFPRINDKMIHLKYEV